MQYFVENLFFNFFILFFGKRNFKLLNHENTVKNDGIYFHLRIHHIMF